MLRSGADTCPALRAVQHPGLAAAPGIPRARRGNEVRLVSGRFQKWLHVTRNVTASDALAGYAPRYWEPTTASFRPRVWCSVSPPRMPLTVTYWWLGWRVWSPGRCRWLPRSGEHTAEL